MPVYGVPCVRSRPATPSRWVRPVVADAAGGSQALAGTTAGTSTVTGALNATYAAAGTTAGTSTVTGNVIVTHPVAGTTAGTSTLTGAVTGTFSLAGSTAGTSSVTAATVNVARPLAASTAGTSTVTGAALVTVGIAGTTAGTSTATGTPSYTAAFGGSSSGTSTASGAPVAAWALAATSAGTSSVSGTVSTGMAASTAGTSIVRASLTVTGSAAPAINSLFTAVSGTSGCLMAYNLQEQSGTTATDSKAVSNAAAQGTIRMGAEGIMGGVSTLAVTTPNGYLRAPHQAAMNWADTVTYVAVVRRGMTHPSGGGTHIFTKGTGSLQLSFNSDSVRLRKSGTGDVFLSTEKFVETHKWHLVIARKTGATVSIRVDGVALTLASGSNQTGVATSSPLDLNGDSSQSGSAMALAAVFNTYVSDTDVATWEALWDPSPNRGTFAPKLGVHGERNAIGPDSDASTLNTQVRSIHARLVRSKADIKRIAAGTTEPAVGSADYARTDLRFQQVETAGMENLAILWGSPQWMTSSTDGSIVPGAGSATDPAFTAWLDQQAKWIDIIVRRYMPGGTAGTNVRLWEGWNEPNLAGFWKSSTAPSAAQYAAWWARVRTVFAAIDPNFNTQAGTLRLAFGALASLKATGAPNIDGVTFLRSLIDTYNCQFEIVSLHPYDGATQPDPLINSGEAAGKANDFHDLQLIWDTLQHRVRPISRMWPTEWGWDNATYAEATIAGYITSSLTMMRDYYPHLVDVATYYSDADWGGQQNGLYSGTAAPFTARQGATAFSNFAVTYDPATLVDGTTAGTSSTTGALSLNAAVAGTTAGTSSLTGAARATFAESGTTAGTSSVTGALTETVTLAGTTAGTSTVTGAARAAWALNGSNAGTSSVSGGFVGAIPLGGTTAGTSTLTGAGNVSIPLAATTAGTSTVTGQTGVVRAVAGTVTASGAVTGAIRLSAAMAAQIAGTSSVAGAVSYQAALAGLTAATGSGTADLTVTAQVLAVGLIESATSTQFAEGDLAFTGVIGGASGITAVIE